MSKKYILNSADKALSPGQVYLEKISSSVLKDLFSSGSYNALLQAEEQEKKNPKQFKRPKTSVKCGATVTTRRKAQGSTAPKKFRAPDVGVKPAQTNRVLSGNLSKPARNIAVVGSTMGLNPRTVRQIRKTQSSPRTKLPSLHKTSVTREVENTKRLCILSAIKPSNVEKEKAKFFKSDFNYNPQFEYSNPVPPLAVNIMELALQRYGSYEKFEQATGGNLLSKSRVCHNVKKYMEKEGCVGESLHDGGEQPPTLTINICSAREHWLEGMLRHEIAAVEQRVGPQEAQPEAPEPHRGGSGQPAQRPLQEGPHPVESSSSLLHLHQASSMSFCQLFHCLGGFLQDPNTRWDYCVRAKRGQRDTKQPGVVEDVDRLKASAQMENSSSSSSSSSPLVFGHDFSLHDARSVQFFGGNFGVKLSHQGAVIRGHSSPRPVIRDPGISQTLPHHQEVT
ncbi:hypothetical protein F7725_024711 [Dissostichus mawsoni]|uniref:Uncharacterized protein n=1 Tax=Dissostichus mawsoni TaxID=36200 RepID=A0A7J5XA76_DISMA|nr:hypothetical protein F7725_024711 [Dissostichus mawsoni]